MIWSLHRRELLKTKMHGRPLQHTILTKNLSTILNHISPSLSQNQASIYHWINHKVISMLPITTVESMLIANPSSRGEEVEIVHSHLINRHWQLTKTQTPTGQYLTNLIIQTNYQITILRTLLRTKLQWTSKAIRKVSRKTCHSLRTLIHTLMGILLMEQIIILWIVDLLRHRLNNNRHI